MNVGHAVINPEQATDVLTLLLESSPQSCHCHEQG